MDAHTPRAPRCRRDGGYVLALSGLLVIPLMAFVGFAVDLGSWYARAGTIQSASDAAALAGVTYLPDFAKAEQAALEVAARNGFVDGEDDISIEVVNLGAQRLRVEIRDGDVPQFFTSVFSKDVSIQRGATAEYILPVAMGSPRNYLGTGDDPGNVIATSRHENFWLAISGPCASRENGDLLMAVSDQNYYFSSGSPAQNPGPSGGPGAPAWNRCKGSDSEGATLDLTDKTPGDTYDPNGYFYAVEIPPGLVGQTIRIDGYDLSHCSSSSIGDSSASSANNRRFRTRYRLRGPDDNPYLPEDNPLIEGQALSLSSNQSTTVCSTPSSLTSGGFRDGWRRLFTITNAEVGIYFIQITTEEMSSTPNDAFQGTNAFGLRVHTGTFSECSTAQHQDPTIYSANCPGIYAIKNMGVLANFSGTYPSFFLADIGPEHSGKTLEVKLFDPGEGAWRLELLDPLGRSVDFDWEVVPLIPGEVQPTGGWSGTVDQPGSGPCASAPPNCEELDLLGNPNTTYSPTSPTQAQRQAYWRGWNPQPGPYYGSRSKYSARSLVLTLELPDDMATEYGGRTWWRVRYHMTPEPGASTDRTTWSVRVLGDPVRLIR